MKIKLSKRLQAIADMVIRDKACADIGTDHGYVPAYLYEQKICPKVILCDVAEGPLDIAKKNVSDFSLDIDDFRLGDGISVLKDSEVSSVIIAGMGGELIQAILEDDINKSHSFERIILQPRTKCDELRLWLSENGFSICDYALAEENGRICEIFAVESKAEIAENPIISDALLDSKSELLNDFIERKIAARKNTLESLKNSKSDEHIKKEILEKEIEYLKSKIHE